MLNWLAGVRRLTRLIIKTESAWLESTGACGVTHLVNDSLPKPIPAIHSNSGLISGVGMYDEFGAVNQVPVISGTNHLHTVAPMQALSARALVPGGSEAGGEYCLVHEADRVAGSAVAVRL